ncbi:hypothetical protein GGD81_004503 [Rhodobium orientis]|uniref:Uncharacterized protein n=1 Tax=Rhodobium orientis TaxID=34017 RepID=A0A327JGG4_9HYPH|nr:hypothetical protein [Rhodobium orientis]MBB4305426.1 hypothetical protein [Rhodobium orientis]MBK5948335.1 hypothetical protein [Rhodobium orientis]RAI25497.1 hypothetical protein CH339_17930 [Rhodobium orientis]
MSGESSFGGHRHGVKKNVLEGLGGMFVGAAAVLVLRSTFGRKTVAEEPAPAEAGTTQGTPAKDKKTKDGEKATKASAAKSTARRTKSTRTTPKRAPRKPATGS